MNGRVYIPNFFEVFGGLVPNWLRETFCIRLNQCRIRSFPKCSMGRSLVMRCCQGGGAKGKVGYAFFKMEDRYWGLRVHRRASLFMTIHDA